MVGQVRGCMRAGSSPCLPIPLLMQKIARNKPDVLLHGGVCNKPCFRPADAWLDESRVRGRWPGPQLHSLSVTGVLPVRMFRMLKCRIYHMEEPEWRDEPVNEEICDHMAIVAERHLW